MPDRRQQGHRFISGAQYHTNSAGQEWQKLVWHLYQRKVHLRLDLVLGIGVEPPMLDVPNDTNDLRLKFQNAQVETLSDCVSIWEKLVRKKFVDHHNRSRLLGIRVRYESTSQKRCTHCLPIPWFCEVKQRPVHLRVIGRFGLPLKPERELRISIHGKRARDQRRCLHTGSVPNGITHLTQCSANM